MKLDKMIISFQIKICSSVLSATTKATPKRMWRYLSWISLGLFQLVGLARRVRATHEPLA